MKLKSSVITVIIVLSFLFAGTNILQAQGIYNNINPEAIIEAADSTEEAPAGGIFFRDGDGFGEGGNERDPDPGRNEPIGEGLLFLSLLAGGYAFVKRNVKRKHE